MSMHGEQPDRLSEYLDVVKGLWPLALMAFGVALAMGARRIRRGYLQRRPLAILENLLFSSVMTGAFTVVAVALLPLVMDRPSREMEIGVALGIGIFGVKGLDLICRRLFRLSVVDLMDPDDINDIRKKMPPEQRLAHIRQCPFKADECNERIRSAEEKYKRII